jgi:hypothetical protein
MFMSQDSADLLFANSKGATKENKMNTWFDTARLGMFVSWGPSSQKGWEIKQHIFPVKAKKAVTHTSVNIKTSLIKKE